MTSRRDEHESQKKKVQADDQDRLASLLEIKLSERKKTEESSRPPIQRAPRLGKVIFSQGLSSVDLSSCVCGSFCWPRFPVFLEKAVIVQSLSTSPPFLSVK